MSRDSTGEGGRVSRRKFLVSTGAAGAVGLAGCTQDSGGGDDTTEEPADTETETSTTETTTTETTQATSGPADTQPDLLTGEGSSTVYPIANKGASYWNGNAPPSDGEYWGHNEEEDAKVPGWEEIQTDQYLADYFASQYGFEATNTRSSPPYRATIGLSHSGTGCKAVTEGHVDIGNSSGPITAELGWSEEKAQNTVVDHVLGRDGQPVVVSKDIWDAGVQQLTGEQIRKIYQGDITNWSEVGGPDEEIYVVARAVGSGTDTAFRLNMLGDADAPMDPDVREGQNHGVRKQIQQNDGAIGYMALAFTNDQVLPVAINFEGTVYEPDKDAENTIFDSDYPLNRDLHMYTLITEDTPSGTDMREAAFISMFLTEFGQKVFVEDVNYIPLPTADIQKEKDKLPTTA